MLSIFPLLAPIKINLLDSCLASTLSESIGLLALYQVRTSPSMHGMGVRLHWFTSYCVCLFAVYFYSGILYATKLVAMDDGFALGVPIDFLSLQRSTLSLPNRIDMMINKSLLTSVGIHACIHLQQFFFFFVFFEREREGLRLPFIYN